MWACRSVLTWAHIAAPGSSKCSSNIASVCEGLGRPWGNSGLRSQPDGSLACHYRGRHMRHQRTELQRRRKRAQQQRQRASRLVLPGRCPHTPLCRSSVAHTAQPLSCMRATSSLCGVSACRSLPYHDLEVVRESVRAQSALPTTSRLVGLYQFQGQESRLRASKSCGSTQAANTGSQPHCTCDRLRLRQIQTL